MDDWQCLREFVDNGSQDAFALIVRRHVDMVYSAALRQVKDPGLAEDVTQGAFVALARKARKLKKPTSLAAWLLVAARYGALNACKSRNRRERHEREAAMQRMQSTDPKDTPDAPGGDGAGGGAGAGGEWAAVAGQLDEVMARLSERDREAITLRYFQKKSFQELADLTGSSLDAARQRVHRATQRMRDLFARRGLTLSAEAIGPLLLAHAIHPAPPGLAAAAAAKAAAVVAHAAAGALAGKGVGLTMASLKTKLAVAAAALLLVSGGAVVTTVATMHHGTRVVPISGNPTIYVPQGAQGVAASPTTGSRGTIMFAQPGPADPPYNGPAVEGVVRGPTGAPVAGARVAVSSPRNSVSLYPPRRGSSNSQMVVRTADDGTFRIDPTVKPLAVAVYSEAGYAIQLLADPPAPLNLTLQPWAHVEGTVRVGSKPAAGMRLTISQPVDSAEWNRRMVSVQDDLTIGEDGHFAADVVTGPNSFGLYSPKNFNTGRWRTVDLVAGPNPLVDIGGDGRPVIGHLAGSVSAYGFRNGSLQANPPVMKAPPNWDSLTKEQQRALNEAWVKSPEYQKWLKDGRMNAQFEVAPDGTFRAEDLPPGEYSLQVQLGTHGDSGPYIETAGYGSKQFTVPPIVPGHQDDPVDIGEVPLKLEKQLAVGEDVPDVVGTTPAGKPIKLSDFRGKYVLLDLWSAMQPEMFDGNQNLTPVLDRFGGEEQFVAVTVNLTGRPAQATKATASAEAAQAARAARTALAAMAAKVTKPTTAPTTAPALAGPTLEAPASAALPTPAAPAPPLRGPQICLDDWGDPRLPHPYTLSPSHLFLITPDQKLLAKNLDANHVYEALCNALPPRNTPNVHVDRQPIGVDEVVAASVPAPPDNAARDALFSIVDGVPQTGSGGLTCLHDGRMPHNSDDPLSNFFFAFGTLEGRLKIDLGRSTPIEKVTTCSWHKSSRAPQIYQLFGSNGDAPNFDPAPKVGTDPASCGWTSLARVNTRVDAPPGDQPGGVYTVNVAGPAQSSQSAQSSQGLGTYRYLLLVTFATEANDPFGATFFSEIGVTAVK